MTLRLGTMRGPLTLKRTPKFLRFVIVGSRWETLDALDQLDDTPRADEHVIAAVKTSESSVHFDGVRNGRRFGEWANTATYDPVDVQPPQDVLRDTAEWRKWCEEQIASQAGQKASE